MFEACIRITENEMTWSDLKALCEEKGLKVITLAMMNNDGKMVPGSSIAVPPDAQYALHFKTAETDMGSGSTQLVSESIGYIDAASREITKHWSPGSDVTEMKVLTEAENVVHGIRSGVI